jgi:hypothetical protein
MPAMPSRRRFLTTAALAGAAWTSAGRAVAAQETVRYLRIGTGATGGSYYPVGTLLANVISNPPGSRPCERGGSCGVPGLIASAVATQGSVQNVEELALGRLDSALIQADIAFWAHRGSGIYEGKPPVASLRAVGALFPEMLHIIVRRDSGIVNVHGLRGKRIAVGEQGSGTLIHTRFVLEQHGFGIEELQPSYLAPGPATDAMRDGSLDGMFFVAGPPAGAVADLAAKIDIALVPVEGAMAAALRQRYPFFSAARFYDGTYRGVPDTPTVSVMTQWIVSGRLDPELVYGITRALWHPQSRDAIAKGHPLGRLIALETAVDAAVVPLHPGAERYYREIGRLPN